MCIISARFFLLFRIKKSPSSTFSTPTKQLEPPESSSSVPLPSCESSIPAVKPTPLPTPQLEDNNRPSLHDAVRANDTKNRTADVSSGDLDDLQLPNRAGRRVISSASSQGGTKTCSPKDYPPAEVNAECGIRVSVTYVDAKGCIHAQPVYPGDIVLFVCLYCVFFLSSAVIKLLHVHDFIVIMLNERNIPKFEFQMNRHLATMATCC